MRNLAEYVMRGRKQAILVALLFAILPFLGWVADAIIALVTLRKGSKEGVIITLWVCLPAVIIALAGYPQIWFYNIIGGTLLTYVLAVVLRHYGSWGMVLQIGMVVGVVAVFLVHSIVPDVGAMWTKEVLIYLQAMKQQSILQVQGENLQKSAELLAKIGTGFQVVFLLLGDFFNVLIARWAQALLYNPNGLRPELYKIRLGLLGVSVFILVMLASLVGADAAIDSIPVIFFPFLLAGLSLVHHFISVRDYSKWWLLVFYGLLILLFPYMVGILVSLAVLDVWWDLRRYFSKVSSSS